MTTPQRIEQAKHRKGEKQQLYTFGESELNALLIQIQDEQKEEMLSELEDVVSKAQFDWEDAYYIIKESPYAYNPKETA